MRTIPALHALTLRARPDVVRPWAGGWVLEHLDGPRAVLDAALQLVPEAGLLVAPSVPAPASDVHLVATETTLDLRTTVTDELIGRVYWPDDAADEGAAAWMLAGGFACWASTSGQLYLVDLALMDRIEELHVAPDFRAAILGPEELLLTVHGDDLLVVTRLADWAPPRLGAL